MHPAGLRKELCPERPLELRYSVEPRGAREVQYRAREDSFGVLFEVVGGVMFRCNLESDRQATAPAKFLFSCDLRTRKVARGKLRVCTRSRSGLEDSYTKCVACSEADVGLKNDVFPPGFSGVSPQAPCACRFI